ncbi:MAG: alpha/beta hydrolase [Actinobacteria bacterium]|jgi:arylformamidase|nr:alpha/beta hydrolase [Actinomycetota bacterium]
MAFSEHAVQWSTMTALQREEAYSPSSCIGGNYQPFVDAYATQSAAARAEIGPGQEVAYGPQPTQTLDLFLPTLPPGDLAPLVVFIHGGYWQELSKSESSFAAPSWVERGMAFAALDYTLAPQATLPEIIEECRQAVRHLKNYAAELNLDPDRLVLAGSSAGAYLAAAVASEIPVLATLLISGIFELAPLVGTSINEALGLTENQAQQLSLRPPVGFPPSIVCWGENETTEFKAQSQALAADLMAQGTECQQYEIAGRNHFDVVFELCDLSTPTSQHLISLMNV